MKRHDFWLNSCSLKGWGCVSMGHYFSKFKSITIFAILLFSMLGYQNCSPMRGSGDEAFSSTFGSPQERFSKAQVVLNNHCVKCHGEGGVVSQIPLLFSSETEYLNRGLVTIGDIHNSKIIYRTIHYSGDNPAPQNMPKENQDLFTIVEYQTLVDWVMGMEESSPDANFACVDPTLTSPAPTHFLTKVQYSNAIEDLFGANVVSQLQNELSQVPDDSFDHYSHERLNGISKASLLAYHRVALKIGDLVLNNNTLFNLVFGNCPGNNNTQVLACLNQYNDTFAKRILRRPLTNTERTTTQSFLGSGADYREDLTTILSYHLHAPQFMIRLELGNTNDAATEFEITNYELASRISFLANDSIPDAQLLASADDGSIKNLMTMKSETRRLLQTPKGQEKVARVLSGWSGMDSTDDISILPQELLSQYYGSGLEAAMVSEAKEFINFIVFETQGSFKDLITSRASFASHPELASIYEHAPANPNRTPGSANASFGGRRQGLLMRAPALTSSVARASSIHRGVHFQAQVLCNELPSPPPDIFDQRFDTQFTEIEKLDRTTREAVAYQTGDNRCQVCHSSINPTGFAFENFGPFGELRDREQIFDLSSAFHQSLPVDTTGDVPTWAGESIAISDAFDLVTHVANANGSQACFSRKLYRFLNEKREVPEDNCMIEPAYNQVSQNGGTLLDAFVNLIANDSNKKKAK